MVGDFHSLAHSADRRLFESSIFSTVNFPGVVILLFCFKDLESTCGKSTSKRFGKQITVTYLLRKHMMGEPPKLKLFSGEQVPCNIGFPGYVSVLGNHLYQCTSWHCYERLCLASANLF